jgi:hypothetical protein
MRFTRPKTLQCISESNVYILKIKISSLNRPDIGDKERADIGVYPPRIRDIN